MYPKSIYNCSSILQIRCPSGRSKGTSFLLWDVGGQDKLRPLWRSYTRCTDGIIFVVDSTREERLEEAKLELLKICKSNTGVKQIPLLVLANKQDLPVALHVDKLEVALGLKELGPGVQWHLQSTCAVTGEGLDEGMDVLHDMIVSNKRSSRTPGPKKFSNAPIYNHTSVNNSTSVASSGKQRRRVQRSKSLYH